MSNLLSNRWYQNIILFRGHISLFDDDGHVCFVVFVGIVFRTPKPYSIVQIYMLVCKCTMCLCLSGTAKIITKFQKFFLMVSKKQRIIACSEELIRILMIKAIAKVFEYAHQTNVKYYHCYISSYTWMQIQREIHWIIFYYYSALLPYFLLTTNCTLCGYSRQSQRTSRSCFK